MHGLSKLFPLEAISGLLVQLEKKGTQVRIASEKQGSWKTLLCRQSPVF